MLHDIKTHSYDNNSLGPIGVNDAMVLKTLAMYLHEPVVLEYGCADGHSAAVWLSAGASSVTCVDLEIYNSARVLESDPRITFVTSSQQDYQPDKIYDIVFLDASHQPHLNVETFKKVRPWINPVQGLLIIHDTGRWAPACLTEHHRKFNGPGGSVPKEGIAHQQGERDFVNWLVNEGIHCVSLGSQHALRHGLTICSLSPTLL